MKIKSSKKGKLLGDATDVFTSWIDPDFKNWGLSDRKAGAVKALEVDIHDIIKNGTFKDFFTDPEKMCMTQEQVVQFCEDNKEFISDSKYWSTWFLLEEKGKFFVADVGVCSGGLGLDVNELSDSVVWVGSSGYRFVLPAGTLKPSALGSSDTLSLESLSARVERLENWARKLAPPEL